MRRSTIRGISLAALVLATACSDDVTGPDQPTPSRAVAPNPNSKDDCKNGGWQAFGFQNQGQCIRFIETGVDTRPAPQEVLIYQDDFSNGLGNWVEVDPNGLGSWTTQNNELFGDYNIGCGSPGCHQTQLLLIDQYQPGADNWRIVIQSGLTSAYCCYNGGAMVNIAKFALYVSDSEKEDVEIGNAWQGTTAPSAMSTVAVYVQAYPWHNVYAANPQVPTWNPADWQTVTLEKHGDTYKGYFNGVLVYSNTRTFSAPPKIGFHTYGGVRMDNFKLYKLP